MKSATLRPSGMSFPWGCRHSACPAAPKNHRGAALALLMFFLQGLGFSAFHIYWLGFDLFLLSGKIDKAPTQILGRIL